MSQRQTKSHAFRRLISLFTLSLFLSTTAADNTQLPDLGSPDLVAYDSNTEAELGRAFTASLHRNYNIYDDLQTNYYIRRIGHQIASHSGINRNFSFYVIEDSSINAFAGPDGVIGVHTGLIQAAETEDELAAVIAHEIAHVTQNHLSRRYEYASTQGNVNSIATLLAAILVGMYDPNAAMATLMGGMGYNLEQQLKNSRVHEHEADRIGIQLLYQAGYNPHAMGDFFARLSKQSHIDTDQLPEILRTHPVSDNRLAEAENRAMQMPKKQPKESNGEFELIKLRLTDKGQIQATPKQHSAKCYQQTLSNTQQTQCIKKVALTQNDSPLYMSQYLEQLQKKNITQLDKQTQKQITLLLELYADNSVLLLNYAKIIQDKSISKAIELIQSNLTNLRYKHAVYKALSELYSKQEKLAFAYFYLAKSYMEIGEVKRAEHYLKQSKKENKNSDKTLEREINLFEHDNRKLLKKKDKQQN